MPIDNTTKTTKILITNLLQPKQGKITMSKFTKTKTRKTIEVQTIKDKANEYFKNSFDTPQERQAVILFLEDILRETGNYNGFQYLESREVPKNELPGIREFDGEKWNFENTDRTRVKYA